MLGDEVAQLGSGAARALPEGNRRGLADERGVRAGEVEDVAQDVGKPVVAIQAQQHPDGAAELDLFGEQPGIRLGRVGVAEPLAQLFTVAAKRAPGASVSPGFWSGPMMPKTPADLPFTSICRRVKVRGAAPALAARPGSSAAAAAEANRPRRERGNCMRIIPQSCAVTIPHALIPLKTYEAPGYDLRQIAVVCR